MEHEFLPGAESASDKYLTDAAIPDFEATWHKIVASVMGD